MSSEAKRIKILTLVALVCGLGIAIAGIVLAVMGATTAAPYVLVGEGVLTLVCGARGALIANVPARIGKLATLALVLFLLQVACIVGVVFLGGGPEKVADEPAVVCASVVPALISLVIFFLSRGMAKRAER